MFVVVDPDANLLPAMRAGAFGLRNGRVLVLYPEGERSIDGALRRSSRKARPFFPFSSRYRLCRSQLKASMTPGQEIKTYQNFAPLKIRFGDPIQPPPEEEASEAAYEKLTAELKSRVVGMWKGLREQAAASTQAPHP